MPRISLAVSVTAVLRVAIIESVSSLLMMVRGANLPPIKAWKVSDTLGSFSFSSSNLSLACFALLINFFSGEGGRSSSASRDHFQCLLLENFVFWQCKLLIGSASLLDCNQSGCGVVHLGYAMSIFWMTYNSSISLSSQSDVGAYACTIVMLKGIAIKRMVMSLLETGRHPMTVFTISL